LTSFHDFSLAEPIMRALAEEKYVTPTPIQTQTIPGILSRRDVIGIAQTGTGKTAAFALPILHHLFTNRRRPERKTCRVLVLSPTRELSMPAVLAEILQRESIDRALVFTRTKHGADKVVRSLVKAGITAHAERTLSITRARVISTVAAWAMSTRSRCANIWPSRRGAACGIAFTDIRS
jgi:superfamily II DNA/RNA helicase